MTTWFQLVQDYTMPVTKREFFSYFHPYMRLLESLSKTSGKPYQLRLGWPSDPELIYYSPWLQSGGEFAPELQLQAWDWTLEFVSEFGSFLDGFFVYNIQEYPDACVGAYDLSLSPTVDVLKSWNSYFQNSTAAYSPSKAPKCPTRSVLNTSKVLNLFTAATNGSAPGFSPFLSAKVNGAGYNGAPGLVSTSAVAKYGSIGIDGDADVSNYTYLEYYLKVSPSPIGYLSVFMIHGTAEFVTRSPASEGVCFLGQNASTQWRFVRVPLQFLGVGHPDLNPTQYNTLQFENDNALSKNVTLSEIRFVGSDQIEVCDVNLTSTPIGFSSLANDTCANKYLTCGTCLRDSSCGWCQGVGCLSGTASGSSIGASCASWSKSTCPMSHPFDCGSFTSCENCAADSRCGWCRSTSTCMAANSKGPYGNATCASFSYSSCYSTCPGLVTDSLTGFAVNKKYWQTVNAIQPTPSSILSNSYANRNSRIGQNSTQMVLSTIQFSGSISHSEAIGHIPGYGYGRISINFKAPAIEGVYTQFSLVSSMNNNSLLIFLQFNGGSPQQIQLGGPGWYTTQSLQIDSSYDFYEYAFDRSPNYVAILANGNVIRNFTVSTPEFYIPSFSISARTGFNQSATIPVNGNYAIAEYKDFQYCPSSCTRAQCTGILPTPQPTPPTPQPSPQITDTSATTSPDSLQSTSNTDSNSSMFRVGRSIRVNLFNL